MKIDRRIQVLLDADHRRELDEAARRVGVPVSTWIRLIALREARRTDHAA